MVMDRYRPRLYCSKGYGVACLKSAVRRIREKNKNRSGSVIDAAIERTQTQATIRILENAKKLLRYRQNAIGAAEQTNIMWIRAAEHTILQAREFIAKRVDPVGDASTASAASAAVPAGFALFHDATRPHDAAPLPKKRPRPNSRESIPLPTRRPETPRNLREQRRELPEQSRRRKATMPLGDFGGAHPKKTQRAELKNKRYDRLA